MAASGTIRRILVDEGVVTSEQWASARESAGPTLDALVEIGATDEGRLLEALSLSAKEREMRIIQLIFNSIFDKVF